MGAKSKIEWTDRTWNAVRGCSRVSPGCINCYAERIASRFINIGESFHGFAKRTPSGPRWTGKVELIEDKLMEPLSWRKPARVFVNSMSDLLHEGLSIEQIARPFCVMAEASEHTFQILTKRAARLPSVMKAIRPIVAEAWERFDGGRFTWPLPNVWLGVSVENQETADERIPLLLQTPAAIRFVSYEPALGAVDLYQYLGGERNPIGPRYGGKGLDWVIIGGESGPGARPFDIAWARNTVDQCKAAGVACFVKQLGARPYDTDFKGALKRDDTVNIAAKKEPWLQGFTKVHTPDGREQNIRYHRLKDKKGGDMDEWAEDLRVRQFPQVTP